MGELRISRRQMLGAGAAGTLGVLLAPQIVLADDDEVELVRWDLVQIVQGVVLAGGTDVGRDAVTGDTVSLTGSGEARPEHRTAAGGGTFVHKKSNGTEVAHGVYVVTAFNSFENGGGSLAGVGVTDGIGHINQTTGGILSLKVRLLPSTGGSVNGVFTVDCSLPGSRPGIKEGITLSVSTLRFVQESGATLFHALED